MGMMSPVFREINYSRINELKDRRLSNSTIAGIISDETGECFTPADVTGYLKITSVASDKMLVSKETMNVLTGKKEPGMEPNPA